MTIPWDIYSPLWQNGSFITPQKLHEADKREDNIRNFLYKTFSSTGGVHNIKFNLTKLFMGIITIEAIECIFPNGQPFSYDSQWRQVNGEEYKSDQQNNIYSIEINCADYNSLFHEKPYGEIGLLIEKNSFQQQIFTPIIDSVRDLVALDDVNEVARQFPVAKLLPGELHGNNRKNFLPLFRIAVQSGIYKIIDYQYPICLMKKPWMIHEQLGEFVEKLYRQIAYIHQENKVTNDPLVLRFTQCIMGHFVPP